MEPSNEGERTLAQNLIQWRSAGLIGACVAGGLVLSLMVIGSAPSIPGPLASANQALAIETFADPSSSIASEGSTVPVAVESAEAPVDPAGELVNGAAASGQPTPTVVVPVAQPVAVPMGGAPPNMPVPAATSPAVLPVAPSPVAPPVATTPAATTPTPTAPASTAPPAPTTVAPTSTAASSTSTVTSPSYTVSGVASLSLRFDGSSISVASLTAQPNWVYEIEKNGPRSVEVKFFNVATGRDREFHATVESGRIKVET